MLGLKYGLACELAVGFVAGDMHVWVRYWCGVWAARRLSLLPSRPALFLDRCVSVGLRRMSGNVVQFRHRILQEHLADPRIGKKASHEQR